MRIYGLCFHSNDSFEALKYDVICADIIKIHINKLEICFQIKFKPQNLKMLSFNTKSNPINDDYAVFNKILGKILILLFFFKHKSSDNIYI